MLNIAVGSFTGLAALFDLLFFGGGYTLSAYLDVNTVLVDVWLGAMLVLMVPCIALGLALLGLKEWARTPGIILSILEMVNAPLGTVVGLYGIWVLLSEDADMVFTRRYGQYVIGRR